MSPQQEAVALWKHLEMRGFSPSINQVGAALHALGLKWRRQDLYSWLKPYRERSVSQQGNSESLTVEQPGNNSGTAFTRALKVSLVDISTPTGVDNPPKEPRQTKLGLDGALAIIAALEPELRPTLTGITWTDWKARNIVALRAMARAGLTPQQVLEKWRETGLTTMAWLQNRIVESRAQKPRNDPKNGCECDLSVADCLRLHIDDGSPQPLAEIIAEQRAAGIYTGSIAHPAARSL